MFRMIAGACLLSLAGATACPAAPVTAERGDVTRLRIQNEALRERMGRLQLDLLIADVIAAPASTPAVRIARTRTVGVRPQLVAFSR